MAKKLPKTMYVRLEAEDENAYFVAETSVEDHAEMGNRRTVGVYVLKETLIVTGKADVALR